MGQWVGFAIGLFVGTAFGAILAGLLAGMKRHEWPDVPVDKAPARQGEAWITQKASNGYVVSNGVGGYGTQDVFLTLDEVLDSVLLAFEGRSSRSGGNKFGKVIILREPTEEYPEAESA